MEIEKKQIVNLVRYVLSEKHSHNGIINLEEAENIVDEYLEDINDTRCCTGEAEQLVCPNCKSKHIGTSTHKGFLQGYCFVCSNHWVK